MHNVIFNKTVTKFITILTKCFFLPNLNPTGYLKNFNYIETPNLVTTPFKLYAFYK